MTKRIVITAGEPAGIGPELMLSIANFDYKNELVISASTELLLDYTKILNLKDITFIPYDPKKEATPHQKGTLTVMDTPLADKVIPGKLNPDNAHYVIETLRKAAVGCLNGEFAALVTGPVHKGILNEGGIDHFTGHTEYFQKLSNTDEVVMMLATDGLRVALATTHLPLTDVSSHITYEHLTKIITILDHDLRTKFGIAKPQIYVCGLNPHAGEMGHLGMEEIEVITPVITDLNNKGFNLFGPLPADTIFNPPILAKADAILAMYHDQGLPVLKYKGFGHAVNVTLGLPFIRTSVDHGTALDLAGKALADKGSLLYAIKTAEEMIARSSANE